MRRILLVVDDEELVLRSLGRILRRGFDVVTATDAADAIEKIEEGLHAIITGHDLGPGPDGRAVLADARVRAPNAKRTLMSGRLQSARAGEDDLWNAFLLKPISRGELFAALSVGTERTR